MAEIETTEQEKVSAEQGNFSAVPQKAGEFTAEQQQEQQQEHVGSFKAKAHEKKGKEAGPGYSWLQLDDPNNPKNDAADWLIFMLQGPLQNWFVANLEAASYYIGKGLDKTVEFVNKKREKQKLGDDKNKKNTTDKDKNGKDKKDKENSGKNKENGGKDKEDGGPKKTSAQERNDHKAQKAQEAADKAKKNMANRKYDNSALGKNQQAFDQMTVDSLQREADFRKNVAANPDYAKSPEGRKARAELVGDRKALAAMQKETGVNNKIVDGNIKKKSNVKKAAQRAKIGLRAAGKAVNDQKKKVTNKVKQAHRKNMQKIKQKANIKLFSNLKTQINNVLRQKTNTSTRQHSNTNDNVARKKQNAGR